MALGQSNASAPIPGEAEARVVGAIVARNPDVVLSSDLKRCRGTAERIAQHARVSLVVRRDLRAQDLGRFEGRVWSEIIRTDEAAALAFLNDFTNSTPPGGESLQDVSSRVVRAVKIECKRRHRGVISIVAHADSIRVLISHYLKIDLHAVQRFALDHFGLTEIAVQGEIATLLRLNAPCGA